MTFTEISNMIDAIGLRNAYDHFAENEAPGLPYIVFSLPGTDNFDADDSVYVQYAEVVIELYTNIKCPLYEKQVEDVLNANELPWDKTETWIPSQWESTDDDIKISGRKMYEVRYVFDVLYEYEDNENDGD